MIKIEDKSKCCGCTACAGVCPQACIKMTVDSEGFLYPCADETQCINCDLCEKVCPIIQHKNTEHTLKAVAVQHKDADILYHSASGGAFSAVAEYIIRKGGIVYGAAHDENMVVRHMSAETIGDLSKFRSSKYVQSQMGNVFLEIQNQLKTGRKVCFSGTPCQIAGLKYFLKKEYPNLLMVDIVCKGVGSPAVLAEYVKVMVASHKSRIKEMNFKRKTYGYHSSTMSVDFEDGTTYSKGGITDPMMRSFRANICLRPSCYSCAFKGAHRLSDLTIFDCWHYSELTGCADDDRGHTTVLLHSKIGEQVIKDCSKLLDIKQVNPQKAIELDGIMVNNCAAEHPRRNEYFKTLKGRGLEAAIKATIPITIIDNFKETSKKILYKCHLLDLAKKLGSK